MTGLKSKQIFFTGGKPEIANTTRGKHVLTLNFITFDETIYLSNLNY